MGNANKEILEHVGVSAKVVLLTPELAKALLEKNIENNRPIKPRAVAHYVKAIKEDRWHLTGEPIIITSCGYMGNGQHRTWAVIHANKAIWVVVVEGIKREALGCIDQGAHRTPKDTLHMNGIKNSGVMAQVISSYLKIQYTNDLNSGTKHSHDDLLDEYNGNKPFWEEVASKTTEYYNNGSRCATMGFIGCYYASLSEIDRAAASEFFDMVFKRFGLADKHPAWHLERQFQKDKENRKDKRMPMIHKSALLIKAWNYYRKGITTIGKLKWDSTKESFPKPI